MARAWSYYADIDPYVCEWAKNLIKAKLVPDGEVDCRSIKEVQPDDLKGFTQAHFFCGLLGWPLALRLAGWPEDRECWSGSVPCQPFSVAGKQKGFADERHLWPEFCYLIGECKPTVLFGEQVAAAGAISKSQRQAAKRAGRGVETIPNWLTGVRGDLERLGYAVGAVPVEAACAGAAQYRDRIWFVAGRAKSRWDGEREYGGGPPQSAARSAECGGLRTVAECDHTERRTSQSAGNDDRRKDAGRGEGNGHVAECGGGMLAGGDRERQSDEGVQRGREFGGAGGTEGVADRDVAADPRELLNGTGNGRTGRREERANGGGGGQSSELATELGAGLEEREGVGRYHDAECQTGERNGGRSRQLVSPPLDGWGEGWTEDEFLRRGFTAPVASIVSGEWAGTQFIGCPDGKYRRLPPPGVRWLGNGIQSRTSKLRAYGNSIHAPTAAKFIGAYLEATEKCRP